MSLSNRMPVAVVSLIYIVQKPHGDLGLKTSSLPVQVLYYLPPSALLSTEHAGSPDRVKLPK